MTTDTKLMMFSQIPHLKKVVAWPFVPFKSIQEFTSSRVLKCNFHPPKYSRWVLQSLERHLLQF